MTTSPRPSEARDRILDAASRLFYREGLRAVGVDRVIAEAGVAKMTLYSHFRSKDDLIVAYLMRKCEQMRGHFRTAADRRPPGERLLGIFDDLKSWVESSEFRGCAFINSAVELADDGHAGHAVVVRHKEMFVEFVADQARLAGISDPDPLARQLALLVEGTAVTALIQGSPESAVVARIAAQALVAAARRG